MYYLVADILRGSITSLLVVILLFTLAQPKCRKKTLILTIIAIVLIDIFISIFFYLKKNYSLLAVAEAGFLIISAILIKPLFKESFMQWFFNLFTTLIFYIIIVVYSYMLCDYFPFPYYSHIVLRIIFFFGVILLFNKILRPTYLQVSERWNIFMFPVLTLLINFLYYFFVGGEVEQNLSDYYLQFSLLAVLTIFMYYAIFQSLKTIAKEYREKAEKEKAEARQEILAKELNSYEDFINDSKQSRHDIRHHNALVLEYLNSGDLIGAKEYLNQCNQELIKSPFKQHCKNKVANAILSIYEKRTKKSNIDFLAIADIPEQLPLSTPELSAVISNILENACESCEKIAGEKLIAFHAEVNNDCLKIELINSIANAVDFDGNMPKSKKSGGGIGTKSVVSIVSKYNGMTQFDTKENMFITRILLPL